MKNTSLTWWKIFPHPRSQHILFYQVFLNMSKCWILSYASFAFERQLWLFPLQFSSVAQSCPTFESPWTAARQASLSITNSQSPPKLISTESVMPSNNLILCCPLLLLPSIFPSIRVFSSESALRIRWPKYWRCNFNISPSNEHPGLISFMMDWLDLLALIQSSSKYRRHNTLHIFFFA